MRTIRMAALLMLASLSLTAVSAQAAINRPEAHAQGSAYEECSVACREFADAQACQRFRKAKLICTEKKKSTWPIFTAKLLGEMEC